MTTQDLRLDAALDELAERITRITEGLGDGLHPTGLRGLQVSRVTASLPRVHGLSSPCVGLVAQGTKRITLGDEVYDYDRAHFIAGSVDLPVASQVIGASPAQPFLALKFELEPREVAELLVEVPALAASAEAAPARGIFLTRVNPELAEAFARLVRLLDSPDDIPALEAGARREVLYRILKSEQGGRLRELAGLSGRSPRIAKAIQWLRQNFRRPLRIEELAALANMSTSSFHEHFRATTSMSPLQFQKQLRLHEARHLL